MRPSLLIRIWTPHDFQVISGECDQGSGDAAGVGELHVVRGREVAIRILRLVHDDGPSRPGRKVVLRQRPQQPNDVELFGFHVFTSPSSLDAGSLLLTSALNQTARPNRRCQIVTGA